MPVVQFAIIIDGTKIYQELSRSQYAQARCHRFGQSKAVKVYRLITRNYEREMLDKTSLKLGLDRAVHGGNKEGNNGPVQQFSKKEIEDLLRKGAYAAIMDENDEGNRFC
ncbi:hypothetical protein JOQ06_029349 [Pogonophryne albipinna]|uniref:Helicase C-terminal domain-containing protein n=1 Tax=Pogonophryne albipinna TaxID=1090488 RepID=A0AAD6FNC8_9TELE|nr:hypothetical protein JOQ06_029349 [Pogonophryne albipinna]